MRQAVLSVLTTCALLGSATTGMPTAAEAQTIIIINGNQPYYPQPYPDPHPYPNHKVVYNAPDYYYGAGYGYYNGYDNGYGYNNGYGGCYSNCYRRPYWGW